MRRDSGGTSTGAGTPSGTRRSRPTWPAVPGPTAQDGDAASVSHSASGPYRAKVASAARPSGLCRRGWVKTAAFGPSLTPQSATLIRAGPLGGPAVLVARKGAAQGMRRTLAAALAAGRATDYLGHSGAYRRGGIRSTYRRRRGVGGAPIVFLRARQRYRLMVSGSWSPHPCIAMRPQQSGRDPSVSVTPYSSAN
jgi:hypothetical protein